MSEIIIRKAIADDAESILLYLNQVGGESDNLLFGKNGFASMPVEKEAALITAINNSSNGTMLVATIDGEVVSIGSLQGFSRERIAHRGNLAISVKKDYWHQGIGTSMMNELISFGKNIAGISVIELEVKEDNTNAIKLYKKLGFKQIGFYEKFFKINGKYYNSYLMNLYLD